MDNHTLSKQRGSLVGSQSRTEARMARDLRAFELHLAGQSVRAVCEEIGLKSAQSGWAAIERGRKQAVERGIDLDVSRIEIHGMFRRTAGLLMETLQHQAEVGQIEVMQTPQGEIRKHRRGVCPRTAGELSRSLNRWGQFLGLQDTPAEVTQHTLITARVACT